MRINPVLRNESKISGRSFKFYAMIMSYIALLAAPILFTFYALTSDVYYFGLNPFTFTFLYLTMACVQAVLLMFIVPALSAPTITSEREKQTLDILLSTSMSPLSIVLGKLLASTSKVILLIVCTIPIYSITFFVGGISFANILQLNLYFIVTTLFVASISVCISCGVKTSKVANVLSYIAVLTLTIGTVLIFAAIVFIYLYVKGGNMSTEPSLPFWLYLNPVLGFCSLLVEQIGAVGPLEMLNIFPNGTGSWIIAIIVQLVLTVGFIFLGAYKLNPLNEKNRTKKFSLKKYKKSKVE